MEINVVYKKNIELASGFLFLFDKPTFSTLIIIHHYVLANQGLQYYIILPALGRVIML